MLPQANTPAANTGKQSPDFDALLESAYRRDRAEAMRARARPVAFSALGLFFVYSLLDIWFFPASLSSQTVALRLLVVCPIILGVLWLSRPRANLRVFVAYYYVAYTLGGISMVSLIWLSRRQGVDMPYDGMLLMLMFGYFLMALPFKVVSVISLAYSLLYLLMEIAMGSDSGLIVRNGFFVTTANVIGMFGAWIQTRNQRVHFLDRTQLELSRKQAEAQSDEKTRFIAMASHDLRQPLHVINLLLENLRHCKTAALREQTLDRLQLTVEHLNRLLSALMDISRLQQGMVKPELKGLDVAAILQQSVEESAERATAQGVRLVADVAGNGLHVLADEILLQRALRNLILNALEHSGATQITLSAHLHGQQVQLSVRDNGQGISPEAQALVFNPFYQLHQSKDGFGGLGLGLAIVRELVDLMRGDVGLESAPGSTLGTAPGTTPGTTHESGSHFWIRLPQAREVSPLDQLQAVATDMPMGRVLLVEDHAPSRAGLADLLRGWGCELVACESAAEALRMIQQEPAFDLLVTDLHLPDGLGDALLMQLRHYCPVLPAVILTADAEQRQHFDREGRCWLLHKPVNPARLRLVLSRLSALVRSN